MIYWLSSTTLYLPPQTIQYDVVQDGSTVITTATHTKQSNVSTLDMLSYTDLIPTGQQGGCAGPYCISTIEPVYGTTEVLTSSYNGTTWSDTITYPTPYGLARGINFGQTAVCADGQTVTSSGSIMGLPPIPAPQTLDYTAWGIEIFNSIPGFGEAVASRYPKIAHCTWGGFNGQPLPKVVVSALTVETTNVVTTTRDSATTRDVTTKPTTREAATTTTPAQTATATAEPQPTSLPVAPPIAEPTHTQPPLEADPDTLVPASSPSPGAGSLILCGLGGPCPSASPSSPTDDQPPADDPPAQNPNSQPAPPSEPESIYTGSSATFVLGPSPSSSPSDADSPPDAPADAVPIYTESGGAVAVGTHTTLSAGGPAATISNVVVSAGTDGVHLGDSVLSYNNGPSAASAVAAAPEATFVLGTDTYTYTSGASAVVLGGTTVQLGSTGAAATVSGATLSVGTQGQLNVDGAPISFAAQTAAATAVATFAIGGEEYSYTPAAGTLAVGSTTLTAGGPAATVGGQVVSLGTAGVVIDGSTVASAPTGVAKAVFTVDGNVYKATQGGSTVVVAGQTLTVGGAAVVVDGETLSLGPSGVVVNGNTASFEAGAATTADAALVTVGGSEYTFKEGETTLVIGSRTLTVGGSAATVSGEVVSLASSGVVVDGSRTVPFSNTAAPTASGSQSGSGVPAQYTGGTMPTKFAVLLFPAFELIDVFGPIDAISYLSSTHRMDLYLISSYTNTSLAPVSSKPRSASMNPYNNSFGASIVPTHTLANAPDDIDVLLVPGGLGTRAPDLAPAIEFIKNVYPRLQYLITVCTGAGLAARAGVLDGKLATTNKGSWNSTTALGPNVLWQPSARWTVDGNIWTSSGVTAGMDVSLAWIAEVYGADVAQTVAMNMEYVWVDDASADPFAVSV
ncbi:Isonitrile hydratase [Lasiodiplodia hormozganensis]|uniref:Isonitrile hydratase n=1 Tax=Lasiodiplodia hormozganensis TaxID=869390 RepID=A0AA39YJ76_9PEZI|nr:Isonitrile hydratase [Lasiodiplodia hormozganensis]